MASAPPDRREHVGFAEAAEYLGISQKTLQRKLIDGGQLPWYLHAGSKRIRWSDLREYSDRNRIVGQRARLITPQREARPAETTTSLERRHEENPGQTRTAHPPEPQPPS